MTSVETIIPHSFSVIMPAYNAELTIKDSIESVLNQTYDNFKLYIINDCSNDNTESIIQSYNDPRIIYIKNVTNKGVSDSRNIGIDLSTSEYISFLDSDDIWIHNKLKLQLDEFKKGYDIVCSNYLTFHSQSSEDTKCRISPELITYSMMLKSNLIGNLTGAYNCLSLGKVYQKKIGHEDYVMWLELIKKTKYAYCIQKPLAKYRLQSSSLSGNKSKAIRWQWKIYRNELSLSLPKTVYYFSHYIFNALKKRR